jgi:hypothetical protein
MDMKTSVANSERVVARFDARPSDDRAMTVLGTEGLRGLSAEERNRRLRGLSFDAARALAETLSADDLNDERIACIEALARCVPGSTAPIAERLATREVKVHPLVLVAGGARVRDVLLARLRRFDGTRPERASAESTQLNAILLGLAWLGRDDDAVVRLFASWRKEQPSWACALYAKPDQYAHEAGWTREYEALGGARVSRLRGRHLHLARGDQPLAAAIRASRRAVVVAADGGRARRRAAPPLLRLSLRGLQRRDGDVLPDLTPRERPRSFV